jgi:drug/metabolite transporter (DMT)-like permease
MTISDFFQATLIAVGFAGWGIIGNYSQAGSSWTGLFVNIYTSIAIVAYYHKDLYHTPLPANKALLILLAAGILNGVAVCLYTGKVSNPNNSRVASFMVLVFVLMAIVAPVLEWILKSEAPTAKQMLGYLFAILSIYFLCR